MKQNKSEEKNPENQEIIRDEKGRFVQGVSGNPAGRPPGQSLKEFWKQRFAEMTPQERLEFSRKVAPETIWRMAEGNPKQDTDITSGGEKLEALTIVKGKDETEK